LPPKKETYGNREKIIAVSRERYSKPRDFVEQKITEWMGETIENLKATLPRGGNAAKNEKEFTDTSGRKWHVADKRIEKEAEKPKTGRLEEGKEINIQK